MRGRARVFYANLFSPDPTNANAYQEKAFDRMDHGYLLGTLRAFGFGPQFVGFLQVLYASTECLVRLNWTLTEPPSEGLDQNLLEKQLIELHQQNQQLLEEKKEMEQKLRAEILQLKEHIASIVQANIRMAEELKQYRTSDDLEKKVSKMVVQMEWQHRELLRMQVAALRKEFAQKESRLTNGKSTPPADTALETREPAVTSSMHTLLANAALASRFTLPNSLVGPQDTATPRPLDISTGDVISFIEPPESLPGTGGNSLEKLEIVELHLDTKPSIANQEAGSPPAHVQLLPTGEMNEPMGLLPSPGGEKRLAQHMLARETKAKQQRTV
ncbi:uncharacterized protein LOC112119284 [Terrapene carolina triunguis]|uniref:uncharacterized protein LOC112119284 n=1 Tax=Terrapene triunguis TaxID=2587831 RepID=UPI000E77C008|nr:uncharacterized protein LOC112119284 [Terrapene carolina triunguis]